MIADIEQQGQRAVVLEGAAKIQAFRLLTMYRAMEFQLRTGFPLTRINVFRLAKHEFGLKGTNAQVAVQFLDMLVEKGIVTVHNMPKLKPKDNSA